MPYRDFHWLGLELLLFPDQDWNGYYFHTGTSFFPIRALLITLHVIPFDWNDCCIQEKDLKQHMDDCGNILHMSNVRVRIQISFWFLNLLLISIHKFISMSCFANIDIPWAWINPPHSQFFLTPINCLINCLQIASPSSHFWSPISLKCISLTKHNNNNLIIWYNLILMTNFRTHNLILCDQFSNTHSLPKQHLPIHHLVSFHSFRHRSRFFQISNMHFQVSQTFTIALCTLQLWDSFKFHFFEFQIVLVMLIRCVFRCSYFYIKYSEVWLTATVVVCYTATWNLKTFSSISRVISS